MIFVQKKYDPGWEKWRKELRISEDFPMRVIHLDQFSAKFWESVSAPLKFLQVFFFNNKTDLKENLPQFNQELKEEKKFSEEEQEDCFDFLVRVIVARFQDLNREEVIQMLNLDMMKVKKYYEDLPQKLKEIVYTVQTQFQDHEAKILKLKEDFPNTPIQQIKNQKTGKKECKFLVNEFYYKDATGDCPLKG